MVIVDSDGDVMKGDKRITEDSRGLANTRKMVIKMLSNLARSSGKKAE